jgi:Smg protein
MLTHLLHGGSAGVRRQVQGGACIWHGACICPSIAPLGAFILNIRYSAPMFDVLVYLYEHYWRPDAFPEANQLARKLGAAGFEAGEIASALEWMDGLTKAANAVIEGAALGDSTSRVFAQCELDSLDPGALQLLQYLERSGMLTSVRREMVLDRVAALPEQPVSVDDMKVIILMVFWSVGQEPNALVMDELFAAEGERVLH